MEGWNGAGAHVGRMLVHVRGVGGGGSEWRGERRCSSKGRENKSDKAGACRPEKKRLFLWPLFKVLHKALWAIYAREKIVAFLSSREREREKNYHKWCYERGGGVCSYLVRESVLEAGWWWVCLTAPLGRNKVNSSHSQSLHEEKWKEDLKCRYYHFHILEKGAEEEEEKSAAPMMFQAPKMASCQHFANKCYKCFISIIIFNLLVS